MLVIIWVLVCRWLLVCFTNKTIFFTKDRVKTALEQSGIALGTWLSRHLVLAWFLRCCQSESGAKCFGFQIIRKTGVSSRPHTMWQPRQERNLYILTSQRILCRHSLCHVVFTTWFKMHIAINIAIEGWRARWCHLVWWSHVYMRPRRLLN